MSCVHVLLTWVENPTTPPHTLDTLLRCVEFAPDEVRTLKFVFLFDSRILRVAFGRLLKDQESPLSCKLVRKQSVLGKIK